MEFWDDFMASKKALNASNLEALGAERLAALLMEVSQGNSAIKRRLRLELVSTESPAELGREIRKRLAAIARSRSFVDWQNRKALVDDLEAPRRAIVQQVAKRLPSEALELTWRFLVLARPVFERSDDGSGTIAAVFHAAVGDLGEIAQAARPDPKQLADQAFGALVQNDYGQYDGLIQALRSALGPVGLEHLKQESMQSRGVVTSGHKLCHWPTFSPWATGIARPHQHPTTLHAPARR